MNLLFLGGNFIEFAQTMRRFGSCVRAIDRNDPLLHKEDPEVSAETRLLLESEEVEIELKR